MTGISAAAVVTLVLYTAAMVQSGVLALATVRHSRRRATAAPLAVMLAAASAWCLADAAVQLALMGLLPPSAVATAWTVMLPLGAAVTSSTWAVARSLGDPGWQCSRQVVGLLSAEPLACVVLAALQPWTGVVHAGGLRSDGTTWWVPGPLFWVHLSYVYGLALWATARVLRVARTSAPLARRQAVWFLVGASITVPPSFITLFLPAETFPDLTAVAFALTGAIMWRTVARPASVLHLVPVARTVVLDHLREAVVVTDAEDRVIDVNASGRRLLAALAPGRSTDAIGLTSREAFAGQLPPRADLADGEYTVRLAHGPAVLDVTSQVLRDARGDVLGHVCVLRDITELVELRRDLADLAVRDELTGLHNRRHLVARLDEELERATLEHSDLCAVILDIDHFKSVNDTYGHAIGDALLASTARALRGALRDEDTVARYGGEEFIVLLPGLDRQQAAERAQDLRRTVAGVTVPTSRGPVRRTVSIGVASAWDAGTADRPATAEDLLRAADEALYEAKAGGRDRVVVAV